MSREDRNSEEAIVIERARAFERARAQAVANRERNEFLENRIAVEFPSHREELQRYTERAAERLAEHIDANILNTLMGGEPQNARGGIISAGEYSSAILGNFEREPIDYNELRSVGEDLRRGASSATSQSSPSYNFNWTREEIVRSTTRLEFDSMGVSDIITEKLKTLDIPLYLHFTFGGRNANVSSTSRLFTRAELKPVPNSDADNTYTLYDKDIELMYRNIISDIKEASLTNECIIIISRIKTECEFYSSPEPQWEVIIEFVWSKLLRHAVSSELPRKKISKRKQVRKLITT